MTVAALFLPLAVAVATVAGVAASHRRLRPAVAVRATTAGLVAVAVASLPSVWLVTVSYLAHAPLVGPAFRWCAVAVGLHHSVPVVVAVPAALVTAVGAVRVGRVVRLERRVRIADAGPVEVHPADEPYAVTVPGRGGRVVVSTALVALLDDEELSAVLAHERAHARHRHDRYLFAVRLVAAALPPLSPMVTRVRFAIERWADEAAARHCGDRALVARALAKVALGAGEPAHVLGFGGLGVTGRVAALLAAPAPQRRADTVAVWSAFAITVGLTATQLHHLGRLVAALCRH